MEISWNFVSPKKWEPGTVSYTFLEFQQWERGVEMFDSRLLSKDEKQKYTRFINMKIPNIFSGWLT